MTKPASIMSEQVKYSESWEAIAPSVWLEDKCEILPRIVPQGATVETQSMLIDCIVRFGNKESIPPPVTLTGSVKKVYCMVHCMGLDVLLFFYFQSHAAIPLGVSADNRRGAQGRVEATVYLVDCRREDFNSDGNTRSGEE